MKVYVVTYIDTDDTCDGKPRCAGIFKTRLEAEIYVKSDIESYADMGYDVDYEHMSSDHCEWNIEEIDFDTNKTERN
jgi:hypothetical protein